MYTGSIPEKLSLSELNKDLSDTKVKKKDYDSELKQQNKKHKKQLNRVIHYIKIVSIITILLIILVLIVAYFVILIGQSFNKLTEANIEPLQSMVIFLFGSFIGFLGQKLLEKW